ncbi:MAG: thiamine phosphate synthase [Candidatus Zixiibacteriota bacterium]|nr:MAG: thiamine phosphate synthase [candidate division Zixibacteria bacterium]
MIDKHELLSEIQLYVIADKKICGGRDVEDVVRQAIEGGAQMIQYRDKDADDADFLSTASKLRAVCKNRGVPFIVNDRAEIAREVDADGVHVGQKDISINQARKILDPAKIVGESARTIHQAKRAEEEGADYVGVGPIFETPSKGIDKPVGLNIIREARENLHIPFFPIGGINPKNVDQIVRAGGRRIAVISAVVLAGDVRSAATELVKKLRQGSPI